MNIKNLLKQLTAEEKASLCSGKDFWHTKNLEGFPIDSVMMCDGPNGVRKQTGESDHLGLHESIKAVCFPTASAIASSFDVEVARELGETLGKVSGRGGWNAFRARSQYQEKPVMWKKF